MLEVAWVAFKSLLGASFVCSESLQAYAMAASHKASMSFESIVMDLTAEREKREVNGDLL